MGELCKEEAMSERLLNFLYKWHRLEKQNKIDIIDFDLIQQGNNYPGQFNSRIEARIELETLIKDYGAFSKREEIILSKLIACKYYLRALQGEIIPLDEYVKNTMGVKPRLLSQKELDDQLKLTAKAYEKLGYEYTKSGLEKFGAENKLSKNEIKLGFQEFQEENLPKIIKWLGIKVKLNYRIKFVDVDAYWPSWISTDKDGELLLQYNLNQQHGWSRGWTEAISLHEICAHALQVLSWKEQIKKKKLNPFLGLTTCFDPNIFQHEGIAQSIQQFYASNLLSDYGQARLDWGNLYDLVFNNIHIMANSGAENKELIKIVKSYLPATDEKVIAKKIAVRKSNPLFRTYTYIYGISLHYHRKIAQRLTKSQKRKYVLDIFQNVYTPREILNKYKIK